MTHRFDLSWIEVGRTLNEIIIQALNTNMSAPQIMEIIFTRTAIEVGLPAAKESCIHLGTVTFSARLSVSQATDELINKTLVRYWLQDSKTLTSKCDR